METINTISKNIIVSIENEMFLEYLKEEFKNADVNINIVSYDQLAYCVAENPFGILILQSDTNEINLIEISKKLKRLFPEEIKIILLSSDYQTQEFVTNIVDVFMQFPVNFEELSSSILKLKDRKKKILIIDDSKLVHKHLTDPLLEAGYEIVNALNGEEGLEKTKETKPDLIICDIEMPKMNGFEVCSAIRKDPLISDIYIIMSSTLGSANDQRRGFVSGVDEYVTKPVIIPELVTRLDRIFKSNLVGRENILLIEPDINIAKNAMKSLSNQGFSPRIVQTMKEALKIMKKFSYDLLITEVELPDGNAVEIAKSLKNLKISNCPSMLVFVSQDNQAEVKMVMNAGATGVIIKPFTLDSLLANVERAVANRKAEIEKAQIEKYISKASKKMAVEKSILSGGESQARAYKKHATVFFSDIKSFTERCEKYSPKEVVGQINTLFSTMTKVIMNSGGDIDKFIGDACMAFWMDDDPVKCADMAMQCVLTLRNELNNMNSNSPLLKDDPIYIRIGLNTGEVILCDIGSMDSRIDLTIIGDAVNLASRLESAGKQYGLDNLVSEFSIKPLLNKYGVRIVDQIRVKGKNEPVKCYELFGEIGAISDDISNLIESYTKGFNEYTAGNFKKALTHFKESLKYEVTKEKINPSSLMLDRCSELISESPAGWDGVWTLKSK